jgi:prepilin-type processing-associated H-X9-DG protein
VQVPPPAGVFAFLDQNERSIEAGVFVLEQKDSNVWPSLPADRHRQGANISFLDGHAEHWLWKARKTYREFYAPAQSDSDVQDMRRLQAALPQNDTPKSAPNP